MGRKTPPWPNYSEWTTARYWSFVRSNIRLMQRKWPPLQSIFRQRRNKPANKPGRHKFEYQCAHCNGWFERKNVQADHIVPTGSLKSHKDIGPFVERMLCGEEGLQILCSTCHGIKTKQDRENMK